MARKLTKKKRSEIIITGAVKCGFIKENVDGKPVIAIIGSVEQYKTLGNAIIEELLERQ